MKNFNSILALGLLVLPFSAATVSAQNIACGKKGDKVLVCHIPPGNPANSHTICISTNAVPAHVPGNNQHNDFLGDCWAGCVGMEVVSHTQGMRSNGTPVEASRSDVSKVLGTPDGVNAPGGFYSLGFGGEIIIKMDGGILNRPGNDLRIFETSFNSPSCASYPEHAEVYVSSDFLSWHLAGTVCQDGEVDIAPLDFIMYVKIVDVSDPAGFSAVVDAYDLDGIQCISNFGGPARLAAGSYDRSVTFEGGDITAYPNPMDEQVSIHFEGFEAGTKVTVEIFDAVGRVVSSENMSVSSDEMTKVINASFLNAGVYTLRVTGDDIFHSQQIVRK
jgi:hypothetical protein